MTQENAPRRPSRKIRMVLVMLALIAILVGAVGWRIYSNLYRPNLFLYLKETAYLHIPTGATFETVKDSLYSRNLLRSKTSFEWVAARLHYPSQIRPGRYLIRDGMSNSSLVRLLRSGKQEPVNLVFNSVRTREQLSEVIAGQIEADTLSLLKLFGDDAFLQSLGFDRETILTMFIPNTYQFYWNTSAVKFFEKMKKEYDRFWTPEREKRAGEAGLTPVQVSVLASILEQETNKNDEKPRIAGVYLNRLSRNMLLQADPTVKFALGNFGLRRILNRDTGVDSPYNTYKYPGLPPGPICIPSIPSILAVLNHEKHDYLFFCASADNDGYHHFSVTSAQHLQYARLYQKSLNKRHILR